MNDIDNHQTNDRLAAALHYREKGWSVIPVNDLKRPLMSWKEFQERRPTEDEIAGWWMRWPDANVAIITGEISGIIAIDADTAKGATREGIESLAIPPTVHVKTPNGEHWYLRHPGERVVGAKGIIAPHIDIQGDGNYVVAPPSVQASGGQYQWLNDPDSTEIAEVPASLLGKLRAPKGIVESAVATPSMVAEGQRNTEATRVAGELLHDQSPDLWETAAWPDLQSWNLESCNPPLEESELRVVFDSIAKSESLKDKSGSNERYQPTYDDRPAIALNEFLDKSFPDTKWTVEGLIESDTVTLITAATNVGKSWVCQHMAFCVAAGEPVFGMFKTEKRNALILDEDSNERQLQERVRLLLDEPRDLSVYVMAERGFKLTSENVEKLRAEVKRLNIGFLVIDTLSSVFTGDENVVRDAQDAMDLLKRIATDGVTVVVCHHVRKKPANATASSSSLGDDARGSSAFAASVSGHISLSPIGKEEKMLALHQVKLRGGPEMKPFRIKFIDSEGSRTLIHDGEIESDGGLSKVREKVLSMMTEADGRWLSIKALVTAKAGGNKTVRLVLKQLVDEKLAVKRDRRELLSDGINPDGEGKPNEAFYLLADGSVNSIAVENSD